jgi:hypothetical protein
MKKFSQISRGVSSNPTIIILPSLNDHFFSISKKIQKTLHTIKFHSKILCHSKTEKKKRASKERDEQRKKRVQKKISLKIKLITEKLEVSIDLLGFFSFGTRFCLVLELGCFLGFFNKNSLDILE